MRANGMTLGGGGRFANEVGSGGLSLSGVKPTSSSFAHVVSLENDPRKERPPAAMPHHAPSSHVSADPSSTDDLQRLRVAESTTSSSGAATTERYWKNPINPGTEDVVLIHVCDENRQVSKDFCCKRNILVKHMRYFERFLAENENGYDDIDISVHCDVEIFEWLMSFIHEPDKPPVLDKAIVVSILISSEFLQMETLVDLCLEHIASTLGEIIRLPIDLSCISDKLVNKLAMLVSPRVLAQTKDRKDKILNKLYKRRVELDFSRKSAARGGPRTIAASLTCCRYCGRVYLDNWVSSLSCKKSPPAIDFRGNLARRHASITGWSLTSYLKSLHSGGMGWDAIYWHVWAACEVFAVGDVVVSALEVERYTIEPDGLLIRPRVAPDGAATESGAIVATASLLPPRAPQIAPVFSLDLEEDLASTPKPVKLPVQSAEEEALAQFSGGAKSGGGVASGTAGSPGASGRIGGQNTRPPEVLPSAVFELLSTQAKFISGAMHRQLIDNTTKQIVLSAASTEEFRPFDYNDVLWGEADRENAGEEERRGRSRTPPRNSRKVSQSLTTKLRSVDSSVGADSDADKDADGPGDGAKSSAGAVAANSGAERRSRSMGTSFRMRSSGTSKKGRESPAAQTGAQSEAAQDPLRARQLAILSAIPPDCLRRFNAHRGPIYGVWLASHPLKLYPAAWADIMNVIQDSALSDSKKLEWELDVLREYDEKRLDRLEIFLVGRRNASESHARSASVTKSIYYKQNAGRDSIRKDASKEYYRDKGRQPYKATLAIPYH